MTRRRCSRLGAATGRMGVFVGLVVLAGGLSRARLAAAALPHRPAGPALAHPGALPLVPRAWVDSTLVDSTIRRGRQDFAGYTTPGFCLAAVRATAALARRGAADSVGSYYNAADTLATATVRVARRCGSRFTVANVVPAELMDLTQLALAAGDDAKARAAAERYAAVAPTPEAHRWAVYAADTLFFHVTPRRWALVDAMTARLDSLGPAAALQRKLAHDQLYMDARERYDVARLRHEVQALLSACAQLSPADQTGGKVSCSMGTLAFELFLVELYQSPGQVLPALDRIGRVMTAAGFTEWPTFRRAMLTNALTRPAIEQIGTQAPPLVVQHWVGPPGRAPGWPVKGKVSVFLRGNDAFDQSEVQRMAPWKRLGEKYKDALDITILVPTRGYVRDGPPLSPAEEAQRLGRYYREQLGVPATVAVVETPMQQLPPPDGRVLLGEPPLVKDPYYGEGAFLLTDRSGKVFLSRIFGESGSEAMLDAWIARALGR